MAEAKRMMESPEFQKQMKEFEKSKEFKDAVKKTKKMMEDPQQAARMAAQMEHMVNMKYRVFLLDTRSFSTFASHLEYAICFFLRLSVEMTR